MAQLTEKVVKGLVTDQAQKDFFHDPTPSAGLRVSRRGRKTWFIKYTSPATREARRAVLGEHPSGRLGRPCYLTVKQFEEAYTLFKADLLKGIEPNPRRVSEQVTREQLRVPESLQKVFPNGVLPGTLGELLLRYLVRLRAKVESGEAARKTENSYRHTTARYLPPIFGVNYLDMEASRGALTALLCDLEISSRENARKARKVVANAYNQGIKDLPLLRGKQNPAHGLFSIEGSTGTRFYSDVEIQRLFQGLDQLSDPDARDFYLLMLASGCRTGEATQIRAEDIKVVGGERVWHLPVTKTTEFLVPLVGEIAAVLDRRLAEAGGAGYLFWPYSKRREYLKQLQTANYRLRATTGIPDFKPYDLRRTVRTHMSGLGVRDEVGEALLNHAKPGVKKNYNLYTFWPERKEALMLWSTKLQELRNGLNASPASAAAQAA
jgi:integrase